MKYLVLDMVNLESKINMLDIKWPEFLQFAVLVQSIREQPHSWILQIIIAQVKILQTAGVWTENWSQSWTAILCYHTLPESEK